MYLFQNHKDYVRMRENGELDISEDAFNALDGEPELAEIYEDPVSSEDEDEDEEREQQQRQQKDTRGRAKNAKRKQQRMVQEDECKMFTSSQMEWNDTG